jgi:thiamine biosynthesis lipoprotein
MTASNTRNQTSINRRDFLKITAIAGLAGLGTLAGRNLITDEAQYKITETHFLMGTIVNFSVIAPDREVGREAIRRTVAEMERLIAIFDYRLAGSPLAQLNRQGNLQDAPIELVEIIQHSIRLGMLSGGAFDITVLPLLEAFRAGHTDTDHLLEQVNYQSILLDGRQIVFASPGMSITLDGIAKGRVVDAGVAVLKELGFENVLVEAGGDMMAVNANPEEDPWTIAISNPRPSAGQDFNVTFSVKNKAVTTSGDYLNYYTPDYSRYHIIDPRRGSSPVELSSATVITDNATEADALSTILMVLGVKEGLEFVRGLPDVEALLVTKELVIHRTDGFPQHG